MECMADGVNGSNRVTGSNRVNRSNRVGRPNRTGRVNLMQHHTTVLYSNIQKDASSVCGTGAALRLFLVLLCSMFFTYLCSGRTINAKRRFQSSVRNYTFPVNKLHNSADNNCKSS